MICHLLISVVLKPVWRVHGGDFPPDEIQFKPDNQGMAN
jgi:hypothetical protein